MTFPRGSLMPDRDRTTFEVPRHPKVALAAVWRAVLASRGRPDPGSATLEGFEFDYTPTITGSSISLPLRYRYSVRAGGRPDGTTQVRVAMLGRPLRDWDTRFDLVSLPLKVKWELARAVPARSIFLSYRRRDSADLTGRILDRLRGRFGPDAVFRDVDDIAPGSDFRRCVDAALRDARAVLAVIGPAWSGATEHRLGDPEDMVRVEIELALARGVPIIPALAMGAAMPSRASLPASMHALADLNAMPVRADPDFEHDMEKLNERLAALFPG
jgi:TIR domain